MGTTICFQHCNQELWPQSFLHPSARLIHAAGVCVHPPPGLLWDKNAAPVSWAPSIHSTWGGCCLQVPPLASPRTSCSALSPLPTAHLLCWPPCFSLRYPSVVGRRASPSAWRGEPDGTCLCPRFVLLRAHVSPSWTCLPDHQSQHTASSAPHTVLAHGHQGHCLQGSGRAAKDGGACCTHHPCSSTSPGTSQTDGNFKDKTMKDFKMVIS